MSIRFNTLMAVPETAYELQNGTVTLNDTELPALDIRVVPGAYSRPELLSMNWTYLNFTSSQLEIQLTFQNPTVVSSLMDSKDSIAVTIYGYPWFMDRNGNFMNPGF